LKGFPARFVKKMRGERLRRWALPQSGILLNEQSTPRHKDLKAGIWMEAVRRAPFLSLNSGLFSSANFKAWPAGAGLLWR